ncbi:D-aminoacyl-tRNA deacylase isoform X2 [Drosophila elegans]|uniref:D-aminoacyl-tRNA deacylase isoform X2 n=1 Tax=Drosophila elegans TaxID=30023 RepID=UPI0007E7D35B|nr:D-aminoacyl-tRNA deacylase isoform X2 [Drosophila elegans]XP_017119303.1 D-aminoacyl-tRNA deacylase isoform X2 [Drosophila elegans]
MSWCPPLVRVCACWWGLRPAIPPKMLSICRVRKILALRLFEEEGKRWQKSVKDLNLELLCVSQFTLYHRLKGNKPDFSAAMKGEEAQQLYNHFLDRLGQSYDSSKIKDGKFGAYMQVHIENDGPVTINLETPDQKQSDEGVDK